MIREEPCLKLLPSIHTCLQAYGLLGGLIGHRSGRRIMGHSISEVFLLSIQIVGKGIERGRVIDVISNLLGEALNEGNGRLSGSLGLGDFLSETVESCGHSFTPSLKDIEMGDDRYGV